LTSTFISLILHVMYWFVNLLDFSIQNTQNNYEVAWSRIKVNYNNLSENNTIYSSNHWQLFCLLTYLASNAKKSTKNIPKNVIWCFVTTTPNLNCCLSSCNTIARSYNLHEFKEWNIPFERFSHIVFPLSIRLDKLTTSMEAEHD